jgi:peptidoglycan hydrolase-like protein with peptidoglycan-binding domain
MAYENLCLYCFEDNGGQEVCPHCGRDARAAVPQVQLLPGTLLYNERFLVGRALGQDASGIVYAALDTKRGVKIRIREYLPRDSARRLNSGEVVPEPGQEDAFEAGMKKLRASVEGVEDPGKRHFFFEESGTGYIAQRKAAGGADGAEGDEEKRGPNMALVVGVAAALVLAVAVGVIMLVNFLTNRTDTKAEAPQTSSEDIWSPPESPTPTPFAEATFGTITDPEQSWKDFTNPDLNGDNSDYATPTPVPTAESGFSTDKTINASSSATEIKNLQKLLTNLGWLASGNVTGVYDNATKQAVKDAQQYINDTYAFTPKLSVDGVAGPKTLAWLVKVDLVAKPTPTPAPITPNPTQAQQVIDENSSKEEIKYIQSQLAILGLMDADQVDGTYGKATRAAVLYFQQRVNDLQGYDALPETGTADATTIAYLEYYVKWWQDKQSQTPAPSATATVAPTIPSEGEVIDESSPAASIKAVQEMLIALGYLNGTADGSYGTKTYAAVKSFQNFINIQHGNVVSVTGKTDEVTRNYLEYYYDNLTAPTPTPTAALGAPAITVTGAETQANGIYYVGTSGAKITWSATGADSYALALQDAAGTIVRKMESTKSTSLDFPQSYLTSSGTFTFTVIAIPAGGSASTGQRASVSLQMAGAQATATPTAVPTATPTAAPSPTPASLKPEITVTGAQGYQDSIYQIGADGAVISWTSNGAGAYSLYVTDENNNILSSQKNTAITSYQLEASGMQAGKIYTFSVVAIPAGGVEKDGEYSSVRLTLASGVGVTPEPTATSAADIEAPVITVTGQLGERDGIYWVGNDAITVSWSAAGHVRAYSVYLKNAQGAVLKQEQETSETSLSVNPTAMTAGQPYEVEVVAIPAGGTEAEGTSASIAVQLYAGETAAPTVTPVGTVEAPVITVADYMDFADGVYYAGTAGLSFSWSAAGSVASYNLIITGSDGATLVDTQGVTKTSGTLGSSGMAKGVLYTLTVTAVPEGGTTADGKSASVQMAVYEQQEVGTPAITVTGAAAEENGGYWVGSDDIVISWSADNAASYDATVEKSDGTSRSLLTGSTDTSLTVKASDFLEGVTYRVTVTAIPAGGTAADGKSASVLLAKQVVTPEIGTPVLSVSGAASQENGVYYAGTQDLTVSWSADNAAMYGVYLLDSGNNVINSEQNTGKTSLTLKPENMTVGETYTITVIAIPDGGAEKDGKSASVQLLRPQQEVPEVGTPQISVTGQAGEQDGVYLVGDSSIGVSWSADKAAAYSVYVYDGSGGLVNSSEKTSDTAITLKPSSFAEGETYKLTVVAIPAGGEEADGKSASVSFMVQAQEVPEVGTPSITVSGYVDYANETYYKGDGDLALSWYADNAATYRAILTDADGSTVLDTNSTTETSATLSSNKLAEGEVYTLTVYAAPAGGSSSDVKSASVMIALEVAAETQPPVADYVDKNSDAATITAMQTALYNLGWLSADAVAEKGTFGPLTRQAVYDFQTYIATEGINPEIEIIDPADENASVDGGTLTTLYDATNPVTKP